MDADDKASLELGDSAEGAASRRCRLLRIVGVSVSVLLLWNGVCDLIYGYSPNLSGPEYFSPAVWDVIRTAGHRPHWLVMVAQTAGWLYPFLRLRRSGRGSCSSHVLRAQFGCGTDLQTSMPVPKLAMHDQEKLGDSGGPQCYRQPVGERAMKSRS
jgi:hypothetical protein